MGLSRGDAYELLELPIGADNDSIRTSYKRLAQKWHPDKHHNSPDSFQKFRQVSHAYRRLITDSQAEMNTKEMLKQFQDLIFTKNAKAVNGRQYYSSDESSDEDDDDDEDYDSDNQYSNVKCKHKHLNNNNNQKGSKMSHFLSPEDIQKNAEELVTEEDKEKKKNDRKKAKKKRRKERKRLEKEKQDGKIKKSNGKKDKMGSSSDTSSDEGTDFESHPAFFKKVINKKKKGSSNETTPQNRKDKRLKNNQESTRSEEEAEGLDPIVLRSRQLAIRGNEMAQLEHYNAAIELFTEAIKLDPKDFRFFGNRSYCFDRMQQYDKALKDAEKAICLSKDWPKGYFRKGRALAGLKSYPDAEKSFMQVLKLDKNCEEAVQELSRVRTYQLTEMGFTKQQAEGAIKKFGSVQTALDSLLAGIGDMNISNEVYLSDDDEPVIKPTSLSTVNHNTFITQQSSSSLSDVKMDPRNVEGLTALWVGNVLPQVSEKKLMQMFSRYGTVTSVRLLPEKYCAFVNYKTKESASKAIAGLQGEECEGQKLLVRFPDHPITGTNNGQTTLRKTTPVSPPPTVTPAPKQQLQQQQGVRNLPKQSGPVNGDECYFWRTTGCIYGEKCRYKHINDHKGLDKKPWQQVI